MFPWEEDMFDKYHESDIVNTPNYPGGVSPSDYNHVSDQEKRPWFDLVVGTQKLPFSPYVGFSLVAANYTETKEHIPTPVDPTKSIVYTEESAYLFKLRAGATFDILSLLSLDANLGVLFPSGKVQTKTTMTEIANYKNEKTLASDGNIGFEARVYPRVKFGSSLEWKSDIVYRFWKIDSKFSTAIDLNGDGDYVDVGENKQSDNHPYSIHVAVAGTGVDYHTEKMRLFASIHNLFQLRNEEWFVVNQSTGTDVYFDKETASDIMNHIIINGGGEFFLKPWFAFRFGIISMSMIRSTTKTSYSYSGTTETLRDVATEGEISSGLLGQLGLSLSLGQFTFDWTMSDNFVTVLGRGIMPYLLSGTAGAFDGFSMIFSMRYNF